MNYYNSLSYIFSIVNLVNVYTESNGPVTKTKAITQKWSTSVILLRLLTNTGSANKKLTFWTNEANWDYSEWQRNLLTGGCPKFWLLLVLVKQWVKAVSAYTPFFPTSLSDCSQYAIRTPPVFQDCKFAFPGSPLCRVVRVRLPPCRG